MQVFTVFILLLLLVSGPAWPADVVLPPVFVTATRTEIPLQQVTTSATVITADEMQARKAERVIDALRTVPGIDVVESGSRGNSTSVFIRGSDADQVLVLIDGVEVNSSTLGSFDFAHLTTDNVDRIEVIRGSGGTLYGSQAIGGVINIITKNGSGPAQLTVSGEGGQWSTHREAASLHGSLGKFGYSLSVARFATDGFHRRFAAGNPDKSNDDYINLNSSNRFDYNFTEDARLTGIFNFTQTKLGLFNSNNFVPGNPGDPNAREAVERYLGKLQWQQNIWSNWDYRVAAGIFKENIKDTDDPDQCTFFGFPCDTRTRSRFHPQIDTGEFQTNYRLGEWSTSTFGIEFTRRSATTSSSSDQVDLGSIDRSIRDVGYYLQQQFQLFDRRLLMIPGIRFDDNQNFGTAWTPSFSAAYLFKASGTKIKTSYAKGFKAPTLNELFFPAGFGCPAFGNPNLGPERSWEVNAGFEQQLLSDRVNVGGIYFHREVKDLIEGRPIPGDPFGCQRAENVGAARFDGVEWTLAIKLLAPLTLDAQYTYLDWDTADGTLPRRARHRGSVGLNYSQDGITLNLTTFMVGRRDDFRAASPFGPTTSPGYVTADFASSYVLPWQIPLVKESAVFGKVKNLFNKKYDEANGFRAQPLSYLIGLRGTFGR